MSDTAKTLCFAVVVIVVIGGRMLWVQWYAETYNYQQKYKQLEAQRDNLLSEHKRLRRYFAP